MWFEPTAYRPGGTIADPGYSESSYILGCDFAIYRTRVIDKLAFACVVEYFLFTVFALSNVSFEVPAAN